MHLVTAPNENTYRNPSLFLAGGISNCSDWQSEVVHLLGETELVLLNPRRVWFDVDDKSVSEAQIAWEYRYLHKASGVLFWFPQETLCPITLYELGSAAERKQVPLFVGCDPRYARRDDVRWQLELVRPEVVVVESLTALAHQVVERLG